MSRARRFAGAPYPSRTSPPTITGGYETTDGAILELSFEGPPADAQPVKDFLEPQLRAARDKHISVNFSIVFTDN